MKKACIIMGILVASSFTFTSCNKDYICVCRLNGSEVSRSSVRDKTKNGAEDQCNEMRAAWGITHECRIE